jgi:hypothetical protein
MISNVHDPRCGPLIRKGFLVPAVHQHNTCDELFETTHTKKALEASSQPLHSFWPARAVFPQRELSGFLPGMGPPAAGNTTQPWEESVWLGGRKEMWGESMTQQACRGEQSHSECQRDCPLGQSQPPLNPGRTY